VDREGNRQRHARRARDRGQLGRRDAPIDGGAQRGRSRCGLLAKVPAMARGGRVRTEPVHVARSRRGGCCSREVARGQPGGDGKGQPHHGGGDPRALVPPPGRRRRWLALWDSSTRTGRRRRRRYAMPDTSTRTGGRGRRQYALPDSGTRTGRRRRRRNALPDSGTRMGSWGRRRYAMPDSGTHTGRGEPRWLTVPGGCAGPGCLRSGAETALGCHPSAGRSCPAASGVRTPRGSGRRGITRGGRHARRVLPVNQAAPQTGVARGKRRKRP
jgi:hypothetical protein